MVDPVPSRVEPRSHVCGPPGRLDQRRGGSERRIETRLSARVLRGGADFIVDDVGLPAELGRAVHAAVRETGVILIGHGNEAARWINRMQGRPPDKSPSDGHRSCLPSTRASGKRARKRSIAAVTPT